MNSKSAGEESTDCYLDRLNKKIEDIEISIDDIKAGKEPYMPLIGMPNSRKRDIIDAHELVRDVTRNIDADTATAFTDKATVDFVDVRKELKVMLKAAMKSDVPESTQRINTLINAVNGLHESYDPNLTSSQQTEYSWMNYYTDNNVPAKIRTFTELSRDSDIVKAIEANKAKSLTKESEEKMNEEIAKFDPIVTKPSTLLTYLHHGAIMQSTKKHWQMILMKQSVIAITSFYPVMNVGKSMSNSLIVPALRATLR